jgi:Zn-dependent peptidase ImmA (M78 family)
MLCELREADANLFFAPPIRTYSLRDSEQVVAALERDMIAPPIDVQFGWRSAAQAFKYWRAIIERAGVFVYVLNAGPENQCRGFCVYDDRQIPIIVINGDEPEGAARVFTLLHEYAHLLLRQAGISDLNRTNRVERWCNQFAAHFLMPHDEFVRTAKRIDPNRTLIDARIKELAEAFKVSMTAAALRLEEAGLAPAGFYETKSRLWNKKKRSGFVKASYAERQINKLGVRYVSTVLDALEHKRVNQIDAIEMMDVYPEHYPALRREIEARQAIYGGVR